MQANTFQQTDPRQRSAPTALIAALAGTTMLFTALLSAYIVRRGLSDDWSPLRIPVQLSYSLVASLVVSVLIELVRRRALARSHVFIAGAAMAGLLFAGMHVQAWQQLVHVRTAATDFLLVISALLVLYALSGSVAVLAVGLRRKPLAVLAGYWQYLNALWAFLLMVFHFYR